MDSLRRRNNIFGYLAWMHLLLKTVGMGKYCCDTDIYSYSLCEPLGLRPGTTAKEQKRADLSRE